MGQPELADDPRYATHGARGQQQAELDDLINVWTRRHTVDEVIALMNKAAVPVGRIYRAPDMLEDLHFKAREAIVRIAHPTLGSLAMQNVAPKLSETPGAVYAVGPALGQHNDEIYKSLLGFDDARLEDMATRGII
jgi:crotonobetainyl-CoA:carnitine CoA-transferase CaiB-like acyl-CoA transferase